MWAAPSKRAVGLVVIALEESACGWQAATVPYCILAPKSFSFSIFEMQIFNIEFHDAA
jgi:hypothetical protein